MEECGNIGPMTQTNAEKQKNYRERKKKLDDMRELGRRYGEDECNRQNLKGKPREERIARAIRYQEFLYERDN